ncbi:hypothetical protein FF2_037448 [Malus domestica]
MKVECRGTEQATSEELQHCQQYPWSPIRVFAAVTMTVVAMMVAVLMALGRLLDWLVVVGRGPTMLARRVLGVAGDGLIVELVGKREVVGGR